jgi:hypothetical protein
MTWTIVDWAQAALGVTTAREEKIKRLAKAAPTIVFKKSIFKNSNVKLLVMGQPWSLGDYGETKIGVLSKAP